MPIKKLKLEKLITDAGTDVRNEIDEATVNEYSESARLKAKFPPLIIFDTPDGLLIADGFHRYYGFERQGIKEWDCDVRKGTKQDALKFALGCNTTHGLRRTNSDKRNAVIIAFENFGKLSDRSIAEMCAVSNNFVSELRNEIDEKTEREKISQVSSDDTCDAANMGNGEILTPPPRKVEGKDGKKYSVPQRPQEPKKPDTMDATGIQVPEEIIPYWDATFEEANYMLNIVSGIRARLVRAQDTSEPSFYEVDHTDCIAKLNQVYVDLKRMKPYAVCNECNGIPAGGADAFSKTGKIKKCQCGGRGFLSEHFWKHCVSSDVKKVTGRA